MRRKLQLTVQNRGQRLKDLDFDDFPVVFGRGEDCHLSLANSGFLSRVHGSITLDKGDIVVSDLNSKNGILSDGKRVPSVRFQGEGRFQVGDLEFECRLREELTDATIVAPDDEKTTPVIRIPVAAKSKDRIRVITPEPSSASAAPPPAPTQAPRARALPKTAVSLDVDARAQKLKSRDVCLQGMITWGGDVFDVRQFLPGDMIRVGPHPTEPIFLPTFLHHVVYGRVDAKQAVMKLGKDMKWRLVDGGRVIASDSGSSVNLKLERQQILSIDLGQDLEMHLRYVEIPRPLVRRTLIENKEEIQRALKISGALHMGLAILLMLGAPKNHAPKVENVPPRFAKLLVEPPKQVFAPPEPPKPPPPPPVVAEKKPEPPPLKKKEKPLPQQAKTKPSKTPPKQVAESRQSQAPRKTSEDQMADSFASAFAAPKTASKLDTQDITVSKASTAATNVSPTELMKTLKSQNGRLPTSSGTSGMAAKMGQVGMATGGLTGKAGKRDIEGVVVGKPSFKLAGGEQGLTQKEIMKEVNKHVAAIQQCYERALLNSPSLAGRVEFAWTIAPNGGVSGTQVKRSDMAGGEALTSCVTGVIDAMKFPVATNGHSTLATIGFPFGRN
ncbi:MAG TPA: AgmX/PglI C-terminal domain-containing protein [Bdellovibrionales bacterium]|nr:AgmX/PglI C-terminal domain-containing protein [Bdellovibrionales bacterium]